MGGKYAKGLLPPTLGSVHDLGASNCGGLPLWYVLPAPAVNHPLSLKYSGMLFHVSPPPPSGESRKLTGYPQTKVVPVRLPLIKLLREALQNASWQYAR